MLDAPAPIPDNAIDLTPLATGFLEDFANILGNAGTSTDGFDSMFLAVVNDMGTVPDLVNSLDPDLVDVGTASGDLGTPWEQDFSSALAGAISQGDPDFRQYNVDITGNTPPPPGTPPAGGSGPSGGAGAGGGGTPPTNCSASLGFPSFPPTPVPYSQTVQLVNNSGTPLQIKGITLVQKIDGVFSFETACGNSLPGHSQCAVTITVNKDAPDLTDGTLTVATDDPNGPDVLYVIIGVAYRFVGCGSGTSSGGAGGTPPGGGHPPPPAPLVVGAGRFATI